jgi:hypothetical protein
VSKSSGIGSTRLSDFCRVGRLIRQLTAITVILELPIEQLVPVPAYQFPAIAIGAAEPVSLAGTTISIKERSPTLAPDEFTIPPFSAKRVSRSRSNIVTQCFSKLTIPASRNDRYTRLICTTVNPR